MAFLPDRVLQLHAVKVVRCMPERAKYSADANHGVLRLHTSSSQEPFSLLLLQCCTRNVHIRNSICTRLLAHVTESAPSSGLV